MVAVGTAVVLTMASLGLYDLQSHLERWDYQRHFED